MSALGEYIHLYYKNYKKYGITRRDPDSNIPNYSMDVINNRIRINSPKVDEGALNKLRERLKINTSNNIEKEKSEWKIHQQKLINEIYLLLQERASGVTGTHRVINISQGNGWTTENKKKVPLSTTQNWAFSLSAEELEARREKAKNLYNEIQSLINKINQEEQPQSEDNLQTLIKLYEQYTHLSKDSLEDSTIGGIEKAIGERRYENTANAIGGRFGEMLVAICDDSAANLAEEQVAKFLEDTVKGMERTEITFDKNLIIGEKRNKHFLNTSTKDGTKYTLGSTQNKVDAQISIQDEDIFASVKSYAVQASERAKTKLQDVDLFSTLVFLNNYESYVDFGNHWLNMHVSHTGHATGARPGRANLDEIVKKEVAFEAFSSGNPLKQGTKNANVFIFINRATGDVYVKNIQEILENNFHQISGLNQISNIYLKNHKQKRVQDRIYNILNELHQKKITVGYNVNFS